MLSQKVSKMKPPSDIGLSQCSVTVLSVISVTCGSPGDPGASEIFDKNVLVEFELIFEKIHRK